MADQLEQFRDCWEDRAGLPEADRIAMVCADLGISPRKAHNLRRCLLLPEPLRERVDERPSGDRISVTMANRLADMHQISPALTAAVADRLTSSDLHDRAVKDLGAFVHRTVVEDTNVYAVRIDDGALLDAHEQIERARQHLTDSHRPALQSMFTRDRDTQCDRVDVDRELDALASRARSAALKIRVDQAMRERAANGMFAWVHQRGRDFADGIWIVDPLFFIDIAHQQLAANTIATVAREEAYFKTAGVHDDELAQAAAEDHARRESERQRHARATNCNLGLGEDIRAGLMDAVSRRVAARRAAPRVRRPAISA